jgi:solute carrier family 15 (peptide/histidine transporter), member 3/4
MLEKVANFGLWPNMALYLMSVYHLEMTTASDILFYCSAGSNFIPVIGAIIADSYVGRYNMIGFGSVVSLLVKLHDASNLFF